MRNPDFIKPFRGNGRPPELPLAKATEVKAMEVVDTRGLYGKYSVERTDGSSDPGGKHENCDYFVLDLTHDPHALPALRAYAESCEQDFPLLARDLRAKLSEAS